MTPQQVAAKGAEIMWPDDHVVRVMSHFFESA